MARTKHETTLFELAFEEYAKENKPKRKGSRLQEIVSENYKAIKRSLSRGYTYDDIIAVLKTTYPEDGDIFVKDTVRKYVSDISVSQNRKARVVQPSLIDGEPDTDVDIEVSLDNAGKKRGGKRKKKADNEPESDNMNEIPQDIPQEHNNEGE